MFGNKETPNLLKLRVGSTFKLFSNKWEIVEVAEYNWKMDNSSTEYTIKSGINKAYLEVEFIKGDYEVVYSEALVIEEAYLIDAIQSEEIVVEGKLFELDEKYQGDYKNLTEHSSRESLDCYIFYAEDDNQITIEKWDDGSYEAFIGNEIKVKKIKNIKQN